MPVAGADGKMRLALNPKIGAPAGGPTYDGAGFHNSGVLSPRPGKTISYTLTFTKPGDYYACVSSSRWW